MDFVALIRRARHEMRRVDGSYGVPAARNGDQFAKPLTIKGTKVHEGDAGDQKPCKLPHYRSGRRKKKAAIRFSLMAAIKRSTRKT